MELSKPLLLRWIASGSILLIGFPLIVLVDGWRPVSLCIIATTYLFVMLQKRSLLIASTLLGAVTGGCAYLLFEILFETYLMGGIPASWPWTRSDGTSLIIAPACAALGAIFGALGWGSLRRWVRRRSQGFSAAILAENRNPT